MQIRAILSGREVHLDIIKGFALTQIVIISGSQQPSPMSPNDGLQIASMNVERKRFETIHSLEIRSKRGGDPGREQWQETKRLLRENPKDAELKKEFARLDADE